MLHLYLFRETVILNPSFNCSNNLVSFSEDKLTTGTYNVQSVTKNSALVGLLIADTNGSSP